MRAFSFYALGLMIFSSFMLSGCAQRLDEVEIRMTDLDERVRIVESSSGLPVGSDRELLESRRLADVRTQLSAMRNEMRVMQGKLEALEFENKALNDRLARMSQNVRESGERSEQARRETQGDPIERAYREALEHHQQGDFNRSRAAFTRFIREHPRHHLADNALFWLGESYMIEKSYRNALVRFQDLIEKYPDSDKKCDAMSRQVEAFEALGMADEAKAYGDLRTRECRQTQ